jgi:hypothetical protein
MDKIQITFPVEENGKSFWIMGSWNEDGNVCTYISTVCNDECETASYIDCDCRVCPFSDKITEQKLLERYEGKMYDAMKALKEIFEME